jgi:hypothetical protein
VVLDAGAPVAHLGAVVGDEATASLSLVVVVEVGASCPLGPVVGGGAVAASGLAAYWLAAVEAGAGKCLGHRRLRRLRWTALALVSLAQGGQRSPGPTNQARQARQRPWAWPTPTLMWCLLPMAAEEGEQEGHVLGPAGGFPYPGDTSPGVGGHPHDGDVVEGGPGPGHALAVG